MAHMGIHFMAVKHQGLYGDFSGTKVQPLASSCGMKWHLREGRATGGR
jgi:hypothetical protein